MTLFELRKINKKSRLQVSEALHVSANAVGNYENGIRSIDLEQVLILADMYGTTAEEVIKAQLQSITVRKSEQVIG